MMVSFPQFSTDHLVVWRHRHGGIAEVLLTLGYSVSGSTSAIHITERLQIWALPSMRKRRHVEGAHVVVTSSAVRADNPRSSKRTSAKSGDSAAEMLAELMRLIRIAVARAHGKTPHFIVAPFLRPPILTPICNRRKDKAGTTARSAKANILWWKRTRRSSFLMLAPELRWWTTIGRETPRPYTSARRYQGAFIQL